MDEKILNKLFANSDIELSNYYNNFDVEENPKCFRTYVINEISNDVIRDYIRNAKCLYSLFYNENKLIFIKKIKDKVYHISVDDIISLYKNILIKRLNLDQTLSVLYEIIHPNRTIKDIIKPNFAKNYKHDYFFDEDDNLIVTSLNYIFNLIRDKRPKNYKDLITNQINLINEVIKNRKVNFIKKKFSDSSLSLIVLHLSHCFENDSKKIKFNLINYFKNKLEYLLSKKDYEACLIYAYQHYFGGSLAYEEDNKLCEKYLLYCFNLSKDPYIANTLGYMYYYGRLNNGIPQGDLAFKYFAFAHFAKGIYESTYKLADCYLHGIGAEISYDAAYNLINSIEHENENILKKNGDFTCKYSDIALRLGNFYKNGFGVKKDKKMALRYYLNAKAAIKKRIETIDYVGDIGLANSISKTIKELNNNSYKRIINKENGFLVKDLSDLPYIGSYRNKINSISNSGVYLTIYPDYDIAGDYKYCLCSILSIGFSEISKNIKLYIKLDKFDMNKIKTFTGFPVTFDYPKKKLIFSNKEGDNLSFSIKSFTIFPNFSTKKYKVAEVKFDGSDKLYSYLNNKKILINHKYKIESKGRLVEVTVINLYECYEDELPIPMNKMQYLLN